MQTDLAPLVWLEELLLLQVPRNGLNSPRHDVTVVMRACDGAHKPVVRWRGDGVRRSGWTAGLGFMMGSGNACWLSASCFLLNEGTQPPRGQSHHYAFARLRSVPFCLGVGTRSRQTVANVYGADGLGQIRVLLQLSVTN